MEIRVGIKTKEGFEKIIIDAKNLDISKHFHISWREFTKEEKENFCPTIVETLSPKNTKKDGNK